MRNVSLQIRLPVKSIQYFDCTPPLLHPKLIPTNFRTNRPAHLVVRKEDVDQEIAKMKSRVIRER